jgi:DNA-binding NarL/FixJ family response regulator
MKRIFMLSNHPLFCEGVSTLLHQESGMDFVGRESDAERAIEQIRVLRPDVVIIDTSDTFAKACSIVARIFDEKLNAKIVGLNLNDNTMCVYREEERVIRGVEDLMSAISCDGETQMNQKGGSSISTVTHLGELANQ